MCIKQVQAWQHGNALFNSEVEAVEAALKEYAQKLMREHSSDPFTGLVGMTDKLVPLLQRYEALTAPQIGYATEMAGAVKRGSTIANSAGMMA